MNPEEMSGRDSDPIELPLGQGPEALGERGLPEGAHVLGSVDSGVAGPTLVALGGIHGNEPSGVEAAKRVLARLEAGEVRFCGRFFAVAGNLSALERGERYLTRDLNRAWTEGEVRLLRERGPHPEDVEGREQAELLALFDRLEAQREADGRRPPLVLVDMHSSSAPGAPFTFVADTLRSRAVALKLPVPVILGIEEWIDGTLLEHLQERGHVAVAVEGGQHDDPRTVDRHETALWLAMVGAGSIEQERLDASLGPRFGLLKDSARGNPGVVEVVHRQALSPDDGFRMREGYVNFDRVDAGEVLASDQSGEIPCPSSGVLLLPLYQGKGDDGFFLGHEVRRSWLRVSALLRRLRMDKLVPLLPGLRKDPDHPAQVTVDRRVARFWAREVLHLLGYRQVSADAQRMVFRRRVEAG